MLRELLPHALKAVWRGRVELFWPIWTAIATVSAIAVAWVVGHATAPVVPEVRKSPIPRAGTPRSAWRGPLTASALLALFLVCYIALMLRWEDFAYYDNSYFTLFSLRGLNYAPPIWQSSGRFFPLCHQEFNLIRHFTGTVIGYHALPMLQLLILSGILLMLDDELSVQARAGLIVFLLITPGIVISFGGLIYPERNVVFCLACLLLFVKRFEQTHFTPWAVAAVISAQIMIYEKETAFLLLLGLAIGRLAWGCWNRDLGVWDFKRLRDKERRLDLCLASLAMLFLLYYAAVMHPRPKAYYGDRLRLSLAESVLSYMKLDLLAWLFAAFALGRIYLILRRRIEPLPFWDGLALGGLACFAGYVCLGLSSPYYLAPVDLIAVLYVGRFVILAWAQWSLRSRLALAVLMGALLLQGVSISALSLFQRKNLIHAKDGIARVVEARYQGGGAQRLFFPFASPYVVSEFAAYLNYRGIPVEGVTTEPAGLNRVSMVGSAVTKDGPCVGYLSVICHPGSSPALGDLVVVLPDDDASLAEAVPYRNPEELLFSYEPHPRIPQWSRPLLAHLRIASPLFNPNGPAVQGTSAHTVLPDRWLDASVSVWQ